MGGTCSACTKPRVDDAEDVHPRVDGNRQVKAEHEPSRARELISIPSVEVLIISSSGEEVLVQVGSFMFMKLEAPSQLAVLFVGESFPDQQGFYYPVLSETPVLLSGKRTLTVHAGDGDVFGIRLPQELPGGDEQLAELMDVLSRECAFGVQQEPDLADKVAGHIARGGQQIASGVEKVAGRISQGIHSTGGYAREKLGFRQELKVSETTVAGVAAARFVTGGAVVVTGAVVDGLLQTAAILGEEASKLAAGTHQEGRRRHAALRVGRAVGVAGLQVFDSLSKAGDALAQESRDEVSAVVGHCYGKSAGEVVHDGIGMAIDAKQVFDMFGNKAVSRLAKKATMYTARGMIEGVRESNATAMAPSSAKS